MHQGSRQLTNRAGGHFLLLRVDTYLLDREPSDITTTKGKSGSESAFQRIMFALELQSESCQLTDRPQLESSTLSISIARTPLSIDPYPSIGEWGSQDT